MTLPIGRSEWIVLDTSIVRAPLERQPDALDLAEFRKLKKLHPVGFADGGPLELMYWLEHSARDDVFERIGPVLDGFSTVLDHEYPLAPGASDLAAFAGLVMYPPSPASCASTTRSRSSMGCASAMSTVDQISMRLAT